MRRVLIVLPNLLGLPGEETPLSGSLPNLEILTEAGSMEKLAPLPEVETPEALFMGMLPDQAQLRQGPLTVAALGADPPERSTHFHLSLASLQDGRLSFPKVGSNTDELVRLLPKLSTRTLTLLPGTRADHGLVWEGIGDLETSPPVKAEGQRMRDRLPQGDNERALRRLIDDSVNLLSEVELNRVREEEGFPPLNILWPWGHGRRFPVPNLWLERGERALVIGDSIRLAGLARLVGYERRTVGPQRPDFAAIADEILRRDLTILVLDAARSAEDSETAERLMHDLDRQLLAKLLDQCRLEPMRIALFGLGPEEGLALQTTSPLKAINRLPFSERSLEESKLRRDDLPSMIRKAINLG